MKKMYRQTNESKVAGVCTGLADHFGLDPVFFRIAFICFTITGGVGLVVYLVMWLIVPKNPDLTIRMDTPHRIHLSNTHKKIAGVCGGFGEYFDVDPNFFRCGFVVLVLVGGLGLLLYVVSWLIIPRTA